jgi:predicted SAM-dependent methyltransferase
MAIKREIDILETYCFGRGANIGCGRYRIKNSLGIDIRNVPGVVDYVADAANLPFADEFLDYIISSHCLEHIDRGPVSVLREWSRCIKLGGVIALIVPDAVYGIGALRLDTTTPGEHLHLFTRKTLKTYFGFVGLEVQRCEQIVRTPERPQPTIICVGIKK